MIYPQAQTANGEGEKEDKLEKHRERPGARELSLRKHVLSIGMTLYRHRSHIHWCKWNHLCHRSAPALGQGALTGHPQQWPWGTGCSPALMGTVRKSSKKYIQIFLVLLGAWTKLMFYFYARKIGRKQHAVWTLTLCSFMLCLKSWGFTSAGENLETPPWLCGCLPAGDRLLPLLLSASCLSTRWSMESTEPEPRAWQRIK